MNENGNSPAYPVPLGPDETWAEGRGSPNGMTKREEFAKAAMQGMCAGGWSTDPLGTAAQALAHADALLAALQGEAPNE